MINVVTARVIAALVCVSLAVFLVHHYLYFWWDWPALFHFKEQSFFIKFIQIITLIASYVLAVIGVLRHKEKDYHDSAEGYANIALFIANAAFWAVFYIGLIDVAISWLRVEESLSLIIGSEIASDLGRSQFRGMFIHLPCLLLAVLTACFIRGTQFIWLALLIVIAEFGIVISRFIFSYEQAFMADLVRFWYAALFLFSSGYTLLHEAHVRVDVLYEGFSSRRKAVSNISGIFLFGLPLCWCILYFGMQTKSASLIAPLLSFEISQSGYGMYVKYLMAGFLFVFAATMVVQFMHLFLKSCAALNASPQYNAQEQSVTGE